MHRCVAFVLAAVALAGCTPNDQFPNSTKTADRHVELVWLYDRNDRTAMDEVKRGYADLATVPGIAGVTPKAYPSADRPLSDQSFDMAYTLTFDSEHDKQRVQSSAAYLKIHAQIERYSKRIETYDVLPPMH